MQDITTNNKTKETLHLKFTKGPNEGKTFAFVNLASNRDIELTLEQLSTILAGKGLTVEYKPATNIVKTDIDAEDI